MFFSRPYLKCILQTRRELRARRVDFPKIFAKGAKTFNDRTIGTVGTICIDLILKGWYYCSR